MRMAMRSTLKWPAVFALLCAFTPHPAGAASAPWQQTEGARIRIVVEPAAPGQDVMRGLLQIDLEPGWKTYWREPGAAGIPPQLTIADSAVAATTIHFPAPEWSDDSSGSWAGYKHPVSLPLTFALADAAMPDKLEADVFLGICSEVCVPVSMHFEVQLADMKPNAMQTLLLDAAFSALPGGNSARLSIDNARWTGDGALEITVHHADDRTDGEADLFITAGSNHPFRKPVLVSRDAMTSVFRVDPVFDPAKAGDLEIVATARRGVEAVETDLRVVSP